MPWPKGRPTWNKGLSKDTDPRVRRNGESLKGNQPMLGKHHTLESKKKIGDAQRGVRNHRFGKKYSEEEKAFLREKSLELAKNPEYIATLSQKARELWQDPKWVKNMMEARQTKPNNLEQRLIDILAEHFPEYKYNGGFNEGVTLGGLIPDFVNINGKKKVIELFGTYFHTGEMCSNWKRSELGKIMVYNSLGFDCLIIWDNELGDHNKLLRKLKAFDRQRRKHVPAR